MRRPGQLVVRACRSFAALWLLSAPLAAQPAPAPATDATALARELFRDAKSLMEAERYSEACEKFQESQRLDPGGGTLLNLAVCHERLGRTATAWAEFHEALALARKNGRADRERLARDHIRALEPKISRLTLVVAPSVRVTGLRVRRNGVELGPAAWNQAIPVDPGAQRIDVEAPGKKPRGYSIVVPAGGASESLRLEPLVDRPAPPPRKDPQAAIDRSRQQLLGAIVTGLGAAALGAGVYYGVSAQQHQDSADELCPSSERCRAEGVTESQKASRAATVSTVAFVGGAVLAGSGVWVLLTAPRGGKDDKVAVATGWRGRF